MAQRWIVKAIVKGNTLVLFESLPLPEGTTVTVTVVTDRTLEEHEKAFYEQLEAEGLIKIPKTPPEQIPHSPPIQIPGKPLSQIIIEERKQR